MLSHQLDFWSPIAPSFILIVNNRPLSQNDQANRFILFSQPNPLSSTLDLDTQPNADRQSASWGLFRLPCGGLSDAGGDVAKQSRRAAVRAQRPGEQT